MYWPNNKHFHRQDTARSITANSYWYASGIFSASEHGGTHLDAPVHFASSGMSLDEIPVKSLLEPAVVLDIRKAYQENADYELTVKGLHNWERQYALIERNDLALLRTGWGAY